MKMWDRRIWLLTVWLTIGLLASSCGDSDSAADPTSGVDKAVDDAERARLQADAVLRLVTVDHSFDAETSPFDRVIVSSLIAGDSDQPLEASAEGLITAGVAPDVAVEFTRNPDDEIAKLAATQSGLVAVVRIEDIRIDADQAEIDLGLWCGTLCAVYLTYGAEFDADEWTITGITGPIAMS
jgi:hypothetical protein